MRRDSGLGSADRHRAAKHGFTMIELTLVSFVLMITVFFFAQSIGSAATVGDVNRETRIALDAANQTLETLRGEEEFSEVFAIYNADPGDDPVVNAPGAGFSVAGLQPTYDDPDGLVGEIVFPAVVDLGGQMVLRESVVNAKLGMPRDLNVDGDLLDDLTNDYRVLPVLVRLRWRGASGVRSIEVQTLLSEL